MLDVVSLLVLAMKVSVFCQPQGGYSTGYLNMAKCGRIMVLILDGILEIGAHVWSEFGCLICLRELI